jgi:hypothetical protein
MQRINNYNPHVRFEILVAGTAAQHTSSLFAAVYQYCKKYSRKNHFFTVCSFGWWLVLVCSERKVLLADCWWLVCSERKISLAGG